jgi:hypothetical protein
MNTEEAVKMPNGAAVAAYLAVAVGSLVLALVAFASDLSKPFEQMVFGIGKLWMPGAAGIGPYSGKETLGLLAWLVSWAILHFSLRNHQLNGRFWLIVSFLAWESPAHSSGRRFGVSLSTDNTSRE